MLAPIGNLQAILKGHKFSKLVANETKTVQHF